MNIEKPISPQQAAENLREYAAEITEARVYPESAFRRYPDYEDVPENWEPLLNHIRGRQAFFTLLTGLPAYPSDFNIPSLSWIALCPNHADNTLDSIILTWLLLADIIEAGDWPSE